MQFASLDFPDELITSLADGRLVIFAGAGISMGDPAHLPDFWNLAKNIAEGTGKEPEAPLERFLGKLHSEKLDVHQRARDIISSGLTGSKPLPTQLHSNLLRLFRDPNKVRIVTTNFDALFETSALEIFGQPLIIYDAPALPSGEKFQGLVHLHGSLNNTSEMVLTDTDFGRAYLIKGWARRFLVDLFHTYVVLFVGYSHEDITMQYLARALPEATEGKRYALVGEKLHLLEKWNLLGIQPIIYSQKNPEDYSELYAGIEKFAKFVIAGSLALKTQINQLADNDPPDALNSQSMSILQYALKQPHTTRFFVEKARHKDWPQWIARYADLSPLFKPENLQERDKELADWLAQNYMKVHSDKIFVLIAQYGMRLNAEFWEHLVQSLANLAKEKQISPELLNKWVNILLETTPLNPKYALLELISGCINASAYSTAVCVFAYLIKPRLALVKPDWNKNADKFSSQVNLGFFRNGADGSLLQRTWARIKQFLMQERIALNMYHVAIQTIEELYRLSEKYNESEDNFNYNTRYAIEQHEKNKYYHIEQIIIDVARDSLEELMKHDVKQTMLHLELLLFSSCAVLRRLGIHGLRISSHFSAAQKADWVLKKINIHDHSSYHEIYILLREIYPSLTKSKRTKLLKKISHYPDVLNLERSKIEGIQLHLLQYISNVDPNCTLVKKCLNRFEKQHSHLKVNSFPEFFQKGWIGGEIRQPPSHCSWNVEKLLEKSPAEWIGILLNFIGTLNKESAQQELLINIRKASTQNFEWGFILFKLLLLQEKENSNVLINSILKVWQNMDLTESQWCKIVKFLKRKNYDKCDKTLIAQLFLSLVKEKNKPFTSKTCSQTNQTVDLLWRKLNTTFNNAINAAEAIADYWLYSLELINKSTWKHKRKLMENCRAYFIGILENQNEMGKAAASVWAGQVQFLLSIDSEWTKANVVPLFNLLCHSHDRVVKSWNSWLRGTHINNPIVFESLESSSFELLKHLSDPIFNDIHQRFIDYLVNMFVFYLENPLQKWIPEFFKHAKAEDKEHFYSHITLWLYNLDESAIQNLLEKWLFKYYQNVIDGVHGEVTEPEKLFIVKWLVYFKPVFANSVKLLIEKWPPLSNVPPLEILSNLESKNLINLYPDAVGTLLIYLCKCHPPKWYKESFLKLFYLLKETKIKEEILHELEEKIADLGYLSIVVEI